MEDKTRQKTIMNEQIYEFARNCFKAGINEVIEFIIVHKKGYYAEPDETLISVISAEWTKEEWRKLCSKGDEMTDSANDNWVQEQGWFIRGLAIPEETHAELLDESIREYAFIWRELAKS